jgi:hypothetical protein
LRGISAALSTAAQQKIAGYLLVAVQLVSVARKHLNLRDHADLDSEDVSWLHQEATAAS